MIIKKFEDAKGLYLTEHNEFNCYKKRIVIKAIKMDKPFCVDTKEGMMQGKEGDYLLKGVKGEVYPCDKEIFEETYKEVE